MFWRQLPLLLWLGLSSTAGQAQKTVYRVQPGDTLWNIAERYFYTVRLTDDLQRLNGIKTPEKLSPGTELIFRPEWLKAKPAAVEVIQVFGDAQALRAGRNAATVTVEIGTRLESGDTLATGEATSVVLKFADGSLLTVRDNSRLVFDRISFQRHTGMVDTSLRLHSGRLESQVKPKKNGGSRFEIRTRAATLGVRGTDFRVGAGSGDQFRSEVLEGVVAVSAAGRSERVRQFFGTVAEPGQAPLPPRALLPRPSLTLAAELLDRRDSVRLRWRPVAGAVGYRLRVAQDAGLTELLQNRLLDNPDSGEFALAPGDYFIAVRSIDELGLEGLDRVLRLTVIRR